MYQPWLEGSSAERVCIRFCWPDGHTGRSVPLLRSGAKRQCQPQQPQAVNDCVASILPLTSTARKRMLLPAVRTNGPM